MAMAGNQKKEGWFFQRPMVMCYYVLRKQSTAWKKITDAANFVLKITSEEFTAVTKLSFILKI
jgi:hypothetical protein